jgi:hypothetical protein
MFSLSITHLARAVPALKPRYTATIKPKTVFVRIILRGVNMKNKEQFIDRDYFATNRTKSEYTRAPFDGEFGALNVPADAFVRVFLINQRSLVKALELPTGERLTTMIERFKAAEQSEHAA